MVTLVSPKKTPQEFGFKAGDSHLVVNAYVQTMKGYDSTGKFLWEIPCLARGVGGSYNVARGDTPPGLYKTGTIYNDYGQHGDSPAFTKELRSYGWITFDMVELEGQENSRGRGGICLHGGGTGCGWPGAWAPFQELLSTFGCLRLHNKELLDKILPLAEQGTVFISVHQDY